MSKRTISIKSGKEEIQMEVTEEEYQNYYRPWWQQKKREQRKRNAKEERGYTEESYEAWKDSFSENRGVSDLSQPDMDEILEKKILLDVLEEAMEALLPAERELVSQLLSYENQVHFYTESINSNPEYECAGIYADEGISGTNTKKRDEFNRMVADCRAGKIDRIITKSISRFARNTLDCLNYVRELKTIGTGILFEKENIDTLDAKGEVLLTILFSLAQDESRNISENCTWGIRKRFEVEQHKMSTKRFLGYDRDENGKLVVNRKQAVTVKRLFMEYLHGKTTDYIKRIFESEGVKNWDGGTKWQSTTLASMLENEKYKGEALLQKSYTTDFLTKKRVQNEGEIQQYYIEEDHEAIIKDWIWECVQLETERRKQYLAEHNITRFSQNTEVNLFSSKIICGECGRAFARKGWRTPEGDRKVWQCSERYKVKGVMGCTNRHIDEETLRRENTGEGFAGEIPSDGFHGGFEGGSTIAGVGY